MNTQKILTAVDSIEKYMIATEAIHDPEDYSDLLAIISVIKRELTES